MITEEQFTQLRAAQKAIVQLENGKSILTDSDEHQALTWAVLELTNIMLLIKKPLTGSDLTRAIEVAAQYRRGEIQIKKEDASNE